jgi:hypothetical protein
LLLTNTNSKNNHSNSNSHNSNSHNKTETNGIELNVLDQLEALADRIPISKKDLNSIRLVVHDTCESSFFT